LGATKAPGITERLDDCPLIVLPIKILDYLDLFDLVAAAVHRILTVAVLFASWRGVWFAARSTDLDHGTIVAANCRPFRPR
jgi:hypothetical protein